MDQQPRAGEVEHEVLAAPSDASELETEERLDGWIDCSQCGELQRRGTFEDRAGQESVEPLRQCLNLR